MNTDLGCWTTEMKTNCACHTYGEVQVKKNEKKRTHCIGDEKKRPEHWNYNDFSFMRSSCRANSRNPHNFKSKSWHRMNLPWNSIYGYVFGVRCSHYRNSCTSLLFVSLTNELLAIYLAWCVLCMLTHCGLARATHIMFGRAMAMATTMAMAMASRKKDRKRNRAKLAGWLLLLLPHFYYLVMCVRAFQTHYLTHSPMILCPTLKFI